MNTTSNKGVHHSSQRAVSLFLFLLVSFTLPASVFGQCAVPASGLVSWWRGESNTIDLVSSNNGTLVGNATYATGEVGRAFSFDGNGDAVNVGNPANLQLQNLTIEAWVKRANTNTVSVSTDGGVIFGYGVGGYALLLVNDGTPALSAVGVDGVFGSQKITDTAFHHLAVTRNGTNVVFYVDGVAFSPGPYGTAFSFGGPAAIGARGDGPNCFLGAIDEVSVYNRALSATEIQAIYAAGSNGKCLASPPVVATQPSSQLATIGNNVTFTVGANGLNLSYQWLVGGSNIPGATNAAVTLLNVQPGDEGFYSVHITNPNGPTNSDAALLKVYPAVCTDPPAGLISWWAGEGTTADRAGSNNGTLVGNAGYAPGKVGQAFTFDGNGDAVNVGNPLNLQLQNLTIEAWIKRANTNTVSGSPDGGVIFGYGQDGYALGLINDGTPYLSKVNSDGVFGSQKISDTAFHHVVVTRNASTVVFYVDGTPFTAVSYGTAFSFGTTAAIGARGDGPNSFLGLIDEVSVYNRALSAAEVQAIYAAGSAGKCSSPPLITSQPTNVTATAGSNATFSVTATGSHPLTYQWQLNGTNVNGGTNSSLIVSNAQPINAGNYSVLVGNFVTSVTSSNAVLTVNVVPSCTAPPSGIVSWWAAEGTANDSVDGNHGTLLNGATFAVGKVGQAFSLNGTGAHIRVPDAPNLHFSNAMTIEAWVYPMASNTQVHIVDKWDAVAGPNQRSYGFAIGADNKPFLFVTSNGLDSGQGLVTGTNAVLPNQWTYLAGTYDGAALKVYVNGALQGTVPYTGIIFPGTGDLGIGGTVGGEPSGGVIFPFAGMIDEASMYNRALGAAELLSIYNAGTNGKCAIAPLIVSQPAGQTVGVGANTSFAVVATGSQPLSYQWRLNGTNLNGATNAILPVINAQPTNAGNYSVVVGNIVTSITSSNAILSVIPAPPCVTPPSGIVSWWPGNSNANDIVGGNNGTLQGNTAFAPGEVGQAFSFDGIADEVNVGNPTNLQLQNLTIETWVRRSSTNNVSGDSSAAVIFGYGQNGYGLGLESDGTPLFTQIGISHVDGSQKITDTSFHHLAVTRNGTNVVFYVDGAAFNAPSYGPAFSFTTSAGIGSRGDGGATFFGQIDEVSVYNRALTGAEILAIYNATSTGKCPSPPLITSQPTNVTVTAGNSALFSINATGSLPLTYQWRLNGTNINGAVSASLTVSNAQPTNAGNYSVVVGNFVTIATSSNAVLTVNGGGGGSCTPPPSGIVGWWPGNSNANDIVSGGNGTLKGNTAFAAGEVGQAFSFDGNGDAVNLGNPTNFQLQNLTIEAWIRRGSISQASLTPGGGVIMAYGSGGYSFVVLDDGHMGLGKVDGINGSIGTPTITDTNYHHIAMTRNGTNVVFYKDGTGFTGPSFSQSFNFSTPVAIGGRGDNASNSFLGAIDEVSIYNRALTAAEVQAIFNAGSSGKCANPPLITSQPTNITVTVGGTASFSVTATGLPPLTYQWRLNGTNISGATSASLTVSNAQPTNAGNYSVVVGNFVTSVTSSNALLTVNPAVPGCTPPPSGIVSWWPGNSNTTDIVGGNNGTLVGNTVFAAGEVGQAFSFDGNGDAVNVGNPTNLQLQNLTIEAWVKRANTNTVSASTDGGLIFGYGLGGYALLLINDGTPAISKVGIDGVFGSQKITDTAFHHLAVTRNGTNVIFYVDGVASVALPYGSAFSFGTTAAIGARGDGPNSFLGAIDEVSIYNRALTGAEVQAIFNAGTSGKCANPPLITSQPTNVTVTVGSSASFSVTATGTPPLTYQWRLNGTNIGGATSASLTVSNAQPTNAGNYSVVVGNFVTSVTSSNAVLTVNGAGGGGCTPPPSGIVSWWPGNSNANDIVNGNNGTLVGNTAFAVGEVGQAFSFDGIGDSVNLGNPANLQLQNLTIEAWIKRGSVSQASLTPGGGVIMAYGSGGYSFVVLDDGRLGLGQVDGVNPSIGTTTVTDTNYHHVAVTRNGTNVVFYKDGTGFTGPSFNQSFNFITAVAIGGRGDNASNSFLGAIDEVSVYNRALTGAEVQAIFAAGSAGKCPPASPSVVQVVSATATSNSVVVPVNLVANGLENALGFSLNFNASLLSFAGASLGSNDASAALAVNTNLVVSGKLGLGIAMPANTVLPAGTQQVALVTFNILGVTSNTVTPVTLGDQPTLRQVVDVFAHTLVANYSNGTVTIPFIGYEGDVSPRSNGDGSVTIADWVQVGRFVALLDTPSTNGNELQRADCAPRSTLGDGVLTVADWVQAGRYSVGADPLTPAGGPGGPSGLFAGVSASAAFGPSTRVVSIPGVTAQAGQTVHVSIMLAAQGDESALGFSVNFNPAVLTFAGASLGSGAAGATLNVNSYQASSGVLGIALSQPIGSTFAGGDAELVKLDFTVAASAAGNTSLSFTSQPVIEAVADVTAETLTANYVGGDLAITPLVVVGGPALHIGQGPDGLQISWPASATGYVLESTDDPGSGVWKPVTNAAVTNAEISVTVTPSASQQFYRLHHP